MWANTCTCTNGVAVTGDSCLTDGASICGSCNAGYTKNAEGTACDGNNIFFKLKFNFCVLKKV